SAATRRPGVIPAASRAWARRRLGAYGEDHRHVARQVRGQEGDRSIKGHDAIRRWADGEVIGGTLRVLSIAGRRGDGQKLLVHWAPGGSGGWEAHYDFTVGGGRIVRVDLQYA
ncbi:hypothetical protein ACWEPC_47120, partial [Nonomuraea sp. NPDC004297]